MESENMESTGNGSVEKVVIYGGSFNPPTKAHLTVLQKAMDAVGAQHGVFMPTSEDHVRGKMLKKYDPSTGEPWMLLDDETRRKMLEAMCAEDARLSVSRVELGLKDNQIVTYDSASKVAATFPGAEVYYAIGEDKLKTIPRWRKAKEFIHSFKFIVFDRRGSNIDALIQKGKIPVDFVKSFAKVVSEDLGIGDISSTKVRRLVAEGKSCGDYLHPAVEAMLKAAGPFATMGFEAWAKDMWKTGRFSADKVRKVVGALNTQLFRVWAAGGETGVAGGLGDRDALLIGTRVYTAGGAAAVAGGGAATKTGCLNADAIAVAEELAGAGLKTAVLNPGDRKRACGEYDAGKSELEEELCRSSTLSQSLYSCAENPKLKRVKEAGVPANAGRYPLDPRFGAVHTPGVVIFRHGKAQWFKVRERPFTCGVITAGELRNPEEGCFGADGSLTATGLSVQADKVRTVLRVALENGYEGVVLGPFGSGAKGVCAAAVAGVFRDVLSEAEFQGKFKALAFAIPEGKARKNKPVEFDGAYAPFYQAFGRW